MTSSARPPPYSLDAELAVLGCILLSPAAIDEIRPYLTPEAFYVPSNRKIYESMLAISSQNKPIDYVTITDDLKQRKILDHVGGVSFISSLTDYIPVLSNLGHYRDIVRDKYDMRQIINIGAKFIGEAYNEIETPKNIIENAEAALFKINNSKNGNQDISSVQDILGGVVGKIEELARSDDALTGISTGYHALDRCIGGLQGSDLIVLAGRPGMGKTTLGLNLVQRASYKGAAVPTLIFSLEMGENQVVQRFLGAEGFIDVSRLRSGKLHGDEWDKLAKAANVVNGYPVFVDETPGISVIELRAKARRLIKKHGIKLIVVDYLQLMSPGINCGNNREREISFISRTLKETAKELDVPIIALSQLSRAVESRTGKVPQLSDLRESGSIEQDADIVGFLYRPEYYEENINFENDGVAQLIIAKNRNGPLGKITLAFMAKYTRFENVT